MGMLRKVPRETKSVWAQPGDTGKNMLEGRECTEIIEPDQLRAFVDRGRGDGVVGNFTTARPPNGGHKVGGSNRQTSFFFAWPSA